MAELLRVVVWAPLYRTDRAGAAIKREAREGILQALRRLMQKTTTAIISGVS
jgi:hypothetical protein